MHGRRRRSGTALTTLLVAVLVLGMLALAVMVWSRERFAVTGGAMGQTTGIAEPATPRTRGVSEGATETTIPGLPTLARKPVPVSGGYGECSADGDGGDRELNRLKNRVDTAAWLPAEFEAVRSLTWSRRVERRHRNVLTRSDRAAIGKYEGLPLSIEGYFVAARQSGPESTNCHGADADYRDWHLWLAAAPGGDRTSAIIVEATPPVRAGHPGWTLSVMRRLARDSTRVRVSGWLFLDPEHPEQVGRTRGTLWEIHPVMRIEARRNGRWEEIN